MNWWISKNPVITSNNRSWQTNLLKFTHLFTTLVLEFLHILKHCFYFYFTLRIRINSKYKHVVFHAWVKSKSNKHFIQVVSHEFLEFDQNTYEIPVSVWIRKSNKHVLIKFVRSLSPYSLIINKYNWNSFLACLLSLLVGEQEGMLRKLDANNWHPRVSGAQNLKERLLLDAKQIHTHNIHS